MVYKQIIYCIVLGVKFLIKVFLPFLFKIIWFTQGNIVYAFFFYHYELLKKIAAENIVTHIHWFCQNVSVLCI